MIPVPTPAAFNPEKALEGTFTNNSGRGNWSQSYTGKSVYVTDPRPEEIDIIDVAHGLSMQCRFAGHIEYFYSVAEHSVRASLIVPIEDALAALLHDASESYIVDIPRPLKKSPGFEKYHEYEERMMTVIFEKYGLKLPLPDSVKVADQVMLLTEQRDLRKPGTNLWIPPKGLQPLPYKIQAWSQPAAERRFLERFAQLYGGTSGN
jgi:hypothetical protein